MTNNKNEIIVIIYLHLFHVIQNLLVKRDDTYFSKSIFGNIK